MTDGPLGSCRLKVKRGAEHAASFRQEMNHFLASNQPLIVDATDPETGDKIWRVDGKPEEPPGELSPIVGDALYNFRSALDHLAWQLVIVNGGTPDRMTAFPIFGDEARYKAIGVRRLRGMSDQAKAEIGKLQPWSLPGLPRGNWLQWLEDLGNIDKHRHLNLAVYATEGGFWSRALPSHEGAPIYNGPIEEGTVLARVPAEHSDVDFFPVFGIAFGSPGPAAGESLVSYLAALPQYIGRIINQFEGQFFNE